ncbi:WD40/YVTN/BNR-like repeat-containing protein [Solitalea koreensis]|uniref:Photosynthesis system II assembly factor Ycf48/Hcf136-like domain-containing protein n=1 Tax=Solitalea koreensis TaxID=543615 RepID=A0A521B238_9SPHI|nr:YCF48-related protein [Solitalea koreensis]SMO41147.1 Uncharacterized protein SAMN06265350_101623 [Solitalea koreensis]
MKKITLLFTLIFLVDITVVMAQRASIRQFSIPAPISIRALEVLNDSTAWFAGNNGYWGYTKNGGKTFTIDSISVDGKKIEFRGISVTPKGTIFLMGIASPGYIFRSANKGKTWDIVYKNDQSDWFMDSMKFTSDTEGWVLGDYNEGCLVLLHTTDAGESWARIPCGRLPSIDEEEAFFAASNSCFTVQGKKLMIASGGSKARVFISEDGGSSWTTHATPIMQGEKMTGIYSIASNGNKTIVVGGDYDKKEIHSKTKAISIDGGQTWKLMADGRGPGFGSCVQFAPASAAKVVVVAAMPGVFISNDTGKTWNKVGAESFYTCRFSPSGQTIWFAGAQGSIGKLVISSK